MKGLFQNFKASADHVKAYRAKLKAAAGVLGYEEGFPADEQRVVFDEETQTIRIDGRISEWTEDQFSWETRGIPSSDPLNVRISTQGGDVFAALSIASQLMARKGEVDAYVDGKAFSAGALIFMAGDRRWMRKGASRLMFHRAWTVFLAFEAGNADVIGALDFAEDIANEKEWLVGIDEDIRDLVSERSGIKAKDIWSRIDGNKEWKLSAQQAVDFGIATGFENPGKHKKPKMEDEGSADDAKASGNDEAEVSQEASKRATASSEELRQWRQAAYEARVNRTREV